MESLRSSTVAALAGVNVQTLRFYERRGLLQRPDRSPGGHRLYTENDVAIVRAIKAAQRLGFSLEEVERLLKQGAHVHNDEALQEHASRKLAEVEARIADLHVVAAALAATIAAECDNLADCAAPRLAG